MRVVQAAGLLTEREALLSRTSIARVHLQGMLEGLDFELRPGTNTFTGPRHTSWPSTVWASARVDSEASNHEADACCTSTRLQGWDSSYTASC